MRLATFSVSAIECALPVERLREIVEPPPITRVPGASAALRGVANLGGRVIPVLDLAIRLGFAPSGSRRPCLLVAEAAEGACALLVDGFGAFEEVPPNRLIPPRRDALGAGDWLAGSFERDGRLVLVLDVDRLLDPERLRAIGPAVQRAGARSTARAGPRPPLEAGPGRPAPSGPTALPTSPSFAAPAPPTPASSPHAAGELSRGSAAARAEAAWARAPRRDAEAGEVPPPDAPRTLRLVVPPRSAARATAPAPAPRPRAVPVPATPAPEVPPRLLPLSGFGVAVVAVVLVLVLAAITAIVRRDAGQEGPRPVERPAAVARESPQPPRLESAPAPPRPAAAPAWTAPPAAPPAPSAPTLSSPGPPAAAEDAVREAGPPPARTGPPTHR